MSKKTVDALHYELKFIAWKMDELKSRIRFLVEKHTELTADLDDMSRHYERTAVLLDELENPRMQPENIHMVDGVPLLIGMMKQELVAEYGCTQQFRVPDPKNVFLYDSEGKIMKCSCGKDAAMMLAGKESFLVQCHECWEKGTNG